MNAEIPTEKHKAMSEFLKTSSLPLYMATQERRSPIGTGTLFTVNSRHYLITAAHVVAPLPAGSLAVPTDRSMRLVTTLGHHEVLRAARGRHDVALIALNDDKTLSLIRDNWRVLRPENLGIPRYPGQPFIVYGYPTGSTAASFSRPEGPVGIISTGFTGEVDDIADPFDPSDDLLLEFPSRLITFDTREPIDAPRISGMSGASVWGMQGDREGEVWTAASQVRIVAIQSAAKQGSYIRAKRWHLLWSAFAEFDKKAAAEIRASLEASRG